MYQLVRDPSGVLLAAFGLGFILWVVYEIFSAIRLFGFAEREVRALEVDIKLDDLGISSRNNEAQRLAVESLFYYARNARILDVLYQGRWTPLVFSIVLFSTLLSAIMVTSQGATIYFVYVVPAILCLALNHSRISTMERIKNLKAEQKS